jgi:hypothetical protein
MAKVSGLWSKNNLCLLLLVSMGISLNAFAADYVQEVPAEEWASFQKFRREQAAGKQLFNEENFSSEQKWSEKAEGILRPAESAKVEVTPAPKQEEVLEISSEQWGQFQAWQNFQMGSAVLNRPVEEQLLKPARMEKYRPPVVVAKPVEKVTAQFQSFEPFQESACGEMGKQESNCQQEVRPLQAIVQDIFPLLRNSIETGEPLENYRTATPQKINGRDLHKTGALGNLVDPDRLQINNITVPDVEMEHLHLENADINNSEFDGKFKHNHFTSTGLNNITFVGKFKGNKFHNSVLTKVNFVGQMKNSKKPLRKNSFQKASLTDSSFAGTGDPMELKHVHFTKTELAPDVRFTNVDIGDADCLEGALVITRSGEKWQLTKDETKQIKKIFPKGLIRETTTMKAIMQDVTTPKDL